MNKRTNKSLSGFRAHMALSERFCLDKVQKATLVELLNDSIMDGTCSDPLKVYNHVKTIRSHFGVSETVFKKALEQEIAKVDREILIESN